MTTPPEKLTPTEWIENIRKAFRSSIAEGVLWAGACAVNAWLEAQNVQAGSLDDGDDEEETRELEAAADLLGVDVHANADQVRAALRRRMSEARVHPDQGGDAETAKRLIAAKNLLTERRARTA